ncbi:MAG: membrane protein insertion efficiency factor YidD [Thermoanaerobaculia bacterium]|nr:membrane protein insertion efficiency factor YidD [Thermoanaerobaculia bacterium]
MNRRRAILLIAAPLLLLIFHDWIQPREREVTTLVVVETIEEYREHVSPRLQGRVFCRFEPTCSKYGLESVKKHGAAIGGTKALWRILRCGPWTPAGTVDPP